MNDCSLYQRNCQATVFEAMADTPVVLITGPRQSGKTTLAKLVANARGMTYLTLDHEPSLLSAIRDPVGMVKSLDHAVIDEVQRAPELLLALKQNIDEKRSPGRFLLTGSANLLFLPTVADSLAGRMESIRLLPLAQNELTGNNDNWIDHAFAGNLLQPMFRESQEDDLVDRVIAGGYPECLARTSQQRRMAWSSQYIQSILARDIREIAETFKLSAMPEFVRALALCVGCPVNYSQLGAKLGLDGKTCARYLQLLQQLYLVETVPMWSGNSLKRLTKAPRIYFLDSGLLACIRGITKQKIAVDPALLGGLAETFVYAELAKHLAWSEKRYSTHILSYRDQKQVEIDLLLEDDEKNLIGIEIKAGASLGANDLRGLEKLAGLCGEKFRLGVIFYKGEKILPMGDKLWAVPYASLWGKA